MSIDEIKDDYNKGHYTVSSAYYPEFRAGEFTKILPENYVFDEELSVKRNKELVAEHNQKVVDINNKKREKQRELDKKLTDDVVNYIIENYNLTDKQARIVEKRVYNDHHSCMYDYFTYIDTFAEFADDLVNQAEEE